MMYQDYNIPKWNLHITTARPISKSVHSRGNYFFKHIPVWFTDCSDFDLSMEMFPFPSAVLKLDNLTASIPHKYHRYINIVYIISSAQLTEIRHTADKNIERVK